MTFILNVLLILYIPFTNYEIVLGTFIFKQRNPISYGEIEGSSPKKLVGRQKGQVSGDLNSTDIPGAQAGTKGLGIFAQRERRNMRDNISTKDILGAQAGTLKKGVGSKRLTNPLNPEYQILGRTQINLRQDTVYAEPIKEVPVKKKINREKPEEKNSKVIPTIEDKKVNNSVIVTHSNPFPAAANVLFQ